MEPGPQPATGFIQQEPLMGEPSTERTKVRILYDDENLYLSVYCFDSAGRASKARMVPDP